MTPTFRRQLGTFGEQVARRHLEAKGYGFEAAAWRGPAGELDLVMRDGDEIVFVEVKTRRGEALGRAEESLSSRQRRSLLVTAASYLERHQQEGDPIWRIDLVAVTLDAAGVVLRVSHFENAVLDG